MKTIKMILAFMAFIAVNTYAQEVNLMVNANQNYTVNKTTSFSVNSSVNSTVVVNQEPQTNVGAEKTKSFSKSFAVDNNDQINLNNQFGTISVKTWDKKEVHVDVNIKAVSTSDAEAQKIIEGINIEANKTGNAVTFKTLINDNNFKSKKNRSFNKEVRVDYTVYMPSVNPLSIMQQFGNVEIGNFSGPTNFNIQYGNLTAGNLNHVNNNINIQYGNAKIQDLNTAVIVQQYGSGITIGAVNTIQINAEYAGVTIGTIRKSGDIKVQYGSGLSIGDIMGNLLLNSEYAKVNIKAIKGNTVIKQGYGSLAIASVGKLLLKTEYTNVDLGALNGDATIDMDYNKLSVNELTPACKVFTFNGEYVQAGLGFRNNYNANYTISTEYSNFKYGTNVTSTTVTKDNELKKYAGKIGSGGSSNINVKANYGSVTFK